MRDAVIAEAVRTPVGRRNGGLLGVHPVDLSALVLQALAARSGLDPAVVDDVYWGCVSQVGEQAWNVGRNAVLAAGWPESVPGTTIDRQCGSSQQALHFAAAAVASGQADVVVAGGVESMSRVPMGSNFLSGPGQPFGPMMLARYANAQFNQGVGAELMAARWGLSRAQLDEYSLASHAKAAAAQDAGAFAGQIAPVAGVSADEGVRRDSTREKLASLPTPFKADGVVSAANASQISDGSAALLVTTPGRARELGLRPLVRVHTAVMAAADPVIMLTAPIPATEKALKRSGLAIGLRGQRGVRSRSPGLAGRDGRRPRAAQPERGRDRARPPARRIGRPARDHPDPPHARSRRPLRPPDHVRGRRHGERDHLRTALTAGTRRLSTGLSTVSTVHRLWITLGTRTTPV
jgi:acetyl-CoA acyltransferase